MQLILENVRGFCTRTTIPIGPLTILVGENSTGKSTLLAMLYAALHPNFPFGENLFNTPPFDLGSFDTIATYKGGKFGRAETFTVGLQFKIRGKQVGVEAVFANDQGSPILHSAKWTTEKATLTVSRSDSAATYAVDLSIHSSDGAAIEDRFTFDVELAKKRGDEIQDFRARMFDALYSTRDKKKNNALQRDIDLIGIIYDALSIQRRYGSDAVALAPLRTKPRRTYDETKDEFKPEGDHIPLLLSRLSSGKGSENAKVLSALKIFGVSSHLFNSISIKRLGKRPSDPFQVRIKGSGPDVNMVDVGYGVSQTLPIVVDAILAKKQQLLLVQQPEVHLHPRAQASLGTFFAKLVKDEQKRFVIETHSDYLVDRVRQEIANKEIKPNDVKILFLERQGLDLVIYPIALDSMGNIQNPPSGYRSFFLEEEMNHLLRGSN